MAEARISNPNTIVSKCGRSLDEADNTPAVASGASAASSTACNVSGKRAAKHQAKWNDAGTHEHRRTPAPILHLLRVEVGREHGCNNAGGESAGILRGGLHRGVESTLVAGAPLPPCTRSPAHISAQCESLHQAKQDREDRCDHTDLPIRRRQREPNNSHPHQAKRKQHCRFAADAVAPGPDHNCADGTADKTHAESGQRQNQAQGSAMCGKKRAADIERKKRIADKIEEFEGIADDDRGNMAKRHRWIFARGCRSFGHRITALSGERRTTRDNAAADPSDSWAS